MKDIKITKQVKINLLKGFGENAKHSACRLRWKEPYIKTISFQLALKQILFKLCFGIKEAQTASKFPLKKYYCCYVSNDIKLSKKSLSLMAEDLKNCLCTVANYMSDLNKTKPMRWREKLGLFKAQFSK